MNEQKYGIDAMDKSDYISARILNNLMYFLEICIFVWSVFAIGTIPAWLAITGMVYELLSLLFLMFAKRKISNRRYALSQQIFITLNFYLVAISLQNYAPLFCLAFLHCVSVLLYETRAIMIDYMLMSNFVLISYIVLSFWKNNYFYLHLNRTAYLALLAVFVVAQVLCLVLLNALERKQRENNELSQSQDDMFAVINLKRDEALSASRSKSDFLSSMSHEIRTPINAVLGMNEMIMRETDEMNILEYAKNIDSSGKMLLALINDILDFSKIESGKMDLVDIDYFLGDVLKDVIIMANQRAKDKNLELKWEVMNDFPKTLHGDEIRIRQILVNLLTNAVKYTKEGTVTLSVSYNYIGEDNAEICFMVKDTGVGIRPEDKDKLFSSFSRVDLKKNRNIEGTGLGLSIVSNLVKLMNGVIGVNSEYGKGSEFTVAIPQRVVDATPVHEFRDPFASDGDEEFEKYRATFEAPYARILVVDDYEMNLKVMQALLKKTKIQIETASSGRMALEMIAMTPYDLIFMDHMMPEMDGIETMHHIKEIDENPNEDTPVIMLTANAVQGMREMYLKEEFADYLTKPIDSVKLEDTILKYISPNLIELKESKKKIYRNAEESEENESNSNAVPENDINDEKQPQSVVAKIDFLNTESGIAYCAGMEEMYVEMLGEFVLTNRLGRILDCYEIQDWPNYAINVHALKSSALMIGADELSAHAKELELAAKDNNSEFVLKNNDKLIDEYRDMLYKIKSVL